MRYILYLFTMALLLVGGMMVGSVYLPQRAATLASSVSVPSLSQENPVLQNTTRQTAERNLNALNQALQACPVVVNEEKDRLVNQIRLLLALEDFEIKKAKLELEMAKNTDTNRPTSQFIQAVADYNAAREAAEQLAEELFPKPAEQPAAQQAPSADEKSAKEGAPKVDTKTQKETTKPAASAKANSAAAADKKAPAANKAEAGAKK